MNTALVAVMVLLAIFAISSGMAWLAIAAFAIALVASLSFQKSPPQKPFFYREPEMPPVSNGIPEQMMRVKFQGDWSGHEDDDEYANLVGEKWGSGLGRGFGFFK